jgi:hypothetical protein
LRVIALQVHLTWGRDVSDDGPEILAIRRPRLAVGQAVSGFVNDGELDRAGAQLVSTA